MCCRKQYLLGSVLHCIQVLYVQQCLAMTLMGTMYVSIPDKTEWRDLCLGKLIQELISAFLTISCSFTNIWNNLFQLSLEFQLVNCHRASRCLARQFESFASEMAVLQLHMRDGACEWKHFWFTSSRPWHKKRNQPILASHSSRELPNHKMFCVVTLQRGFILIEMDFLRG